ncbi:MAG: family 43 glycosylhydrolase [Lutimonas sp.]|jgi:hypothetical protein
MIKSIIAFLITLTVISCGSSSEDKEPIEEHAESSTSFPLYIENLDPDRELSAAMKRSFQQYEAPRFLDNELYSNFKYTRLAGLDYNNGDGTISRRDPSKVIFANGKYYMWYTHRETTTAPMGYASSNDSIPSVDWDLCEIWYATSKDGFTWEEQGVAVPRPPKPYPGHRSVATSDILFYKGKYYLYYQAFSEPSGNGKDECPVAMSYADNPDGPWTPLNKIVVNFGDDDEWDHRVIHDPYPLVHNGKIYLYYKSGFDVRDAAGKHWDGAGLAIAESPEGPFEKHPLNPVMNSGHEVSLFPYKEGVAAIVTTDGLEHHTIQYAKDWVNFEIASVSTLLPIAAGPFSKDAFTDNPNADGITWGISHFINAGMDHSKFHSALVRFDCDLSKKTNDISLKRPYIYHSYDVYYKQGLNENQRERIAKENEEVLKGN